MEPRAKGGQDVVSSVDAAAHPAWLHQPQGARRHRRIATERHDLGRLPNVFEILDVIFVKVHQQERVDDLSVIGDGWEPWP